MNGTTGNEPGYPQTALLPSPVILAATKCDPDAMKIVLQHFSGYIARLSIPYENHYTIHESFMLVCKNQYIIRPCQIRTWCIMNKVVRFSLYL